MHQADLGGGPSALSPVRHILEHLGKWEARKPLLPAHRPPPEKEDRPAVADTWDEAFQPAPADELYFMNPLYPD